MKKKVIHTLMALVLTLTIISVSVVFTLAFRPLYYADINALNIPERTGYSEEMLRENYNVLIDYNLSFGDEPLEFPSLAMSESGRIHFEEVKDFQSVQIYGHRRSADKCCRDLADEPPERISVSEADLDSGGRPAGCDRAFCGGELGLGFCDLPPHRL